VRATYPILRKLVSQVLSRFLDSGLMAKFLVVANIVKSKGGNIDHSVNLAGRCYVTWKPHLIVTYDPLIKTMVDHIEKPLLVSCIARQTDLLSTTLRCFGLCKIDKCEVRPINWVDSQGSPGTRLASLYVLSSFVTGAGTHRRTGGLVETRAGIIDKNTRERRLPEGWENTLFYEHVI
jgi:hypothetical protein